MRRLILSLLLLSAVVEFPAAAQAPRVRAFSTATDSLTQRFKRRCGVDNAFKLERVQARGTELDFYYSQNLAGYPWRKGDAKWFKSQLSELAQDILNDFTVGDIYARKVEISQLEMPLPSKDGSAVANNFRFKQATNIHPLVQGEKIWPSGLSGRHIALWHSHGNYWESKTSRWEWQRAAIHRTVEDLFTQSFVLPFLMPMLENAGAVIVSPRERDTQPYEVICDNDPGFPGERDGLLRRLGSYEEKGRWESAGEGFADAKKAYSGNENPFKMGTARVAEAAGSSDVARYAEIRWRPNIPEKGEYAVYISYKSLPRSIPDAKYVVHHQGGESVFRVNQSMGGGTWIYLGTFSFDKGFSGFVSLSNESERAGVVSADAVRFGGGMGKIERPGGVSGKPAYQEGALYYMQCSGMDLSLLDKWDDDYTRDFAGRGRWVKSMSDRNIPIDMSLAFHSDAGVTPNDSIVGTMTIYTLLDDDGKDVFPNGENRLTSRLLADFVQTQVVDDIRKKYEPHWMRRETRDRSYSESRTPGVPAMVLELMAHQNFADMRLGLDPGFRFDVSRSVYKGVLKYLSARYGVNYSVQPLPPHAFSARLQDDKAVLEWKDTPDEGEPTAVSAWYYVYTRKDDGAFDNGRVVNEPSYSVPIEPGHVYSFKVTACNNGGESFPSEILAVGRPKDSEAKKVLIVNNFTRISAPTWFDTPTHAGFTDHLDSGVPWGKDILFAGSVNQFDRSEVWTDDDNPGFGGSFLDNNGKPVAGNSFDYPSRHGRALLSAGYAFESTSVEAFTGEKGELFAVDLICGKQVTTRIGRGAVPDRYTVFTPALQNALRSFTSEGGNVILSGAYIGTDAWSSIYQGVPKKGRANTQKFIQEVLGYTWLTNFGDVNGFVDAAPGMKFPSATYNREYSPSVYRVEQPDGIRPATTNGKELMRYKATGICAATLFEAEGYSCAAFAFPLETSEQIGELMRNTLRLFEGR